MKRYGHASALHMELKCKSWDKCIPDNINLNRTHVTITRKIDVFIAGAILTKVEVTYKLVNVSFNLGLGSHGFTQQVVSVIRNMYYIW